MATSMIYVVDDDDLLRRTLGSLLENFGYTVCLCASAAEFLERYDPQPQECLILDIQMPAMNGLELQKVMNSRGITIPTIIMTGHGDISMAVSAMKVGARDFLEKPFNEEHLLSIIREILSRQSDTSADDAGDGIKKLSVLTPRELEIAHLICDGRQNKQIAADLGISSRTVENHRARIMQKLEVKTASQLIRLILAAGNRN